MPRLWGSPGTADDDRDQELLAQIVASVGAEPIRDRPCSHCRSRALFRLPGGTEPATVCVICDMAFEFPRLDSVG